MKRFKWWRRLMGGTWYYVHAFPPENSQFTDYKYWTRAISVDLKSTHFRFKLLKTENYYL